MLRGHPGRLAPAVEGLRLAAAGHRFDPDGTAARRFLGWRVGPHWLLSR
ncbi:hypothetical protein ACFVHB_37295 [Kitasatospora sp. NPDC127111]